VWHTDEMTVKVKKKWKWLWNVMDKETRFLLASAISEKREIQDARRVFALAKEMAKDRSDVVILTAYTPTKRLSRRGSSH